MIIKIPGAALAAEGALEACVLDDLQELLFWIGGEGFDLFYQFARGT
ncbi:hypothetical protein [Methanocella arvoryzae]|nr:hypothetical protein [Methanocella arvoryzae]